MSGFDDNSPSDSYLVESILAGDRSGFEPLMRRYNQRLYRVSRSIVRDDADAEDVVQHAYITAFGQLSQLENASLFSAWVTRIAINRAIAVCRERRSRSQPKTDARGTSNAAERVIDYRGPEDHASSNELREVLRRAVDKLPRRLSTVYVLREIEGMETAEVAECLGISPGNVKVRLHRARELLRDFIDEDIGVEARSLYGFGGVQCNRIVETVLDVVSVNADQLDHKEKTERTHWFDTN